MSKRVTIKSIARDLGISHMTVSRALSDHPNVQQATRDAVLKHAEAVGYVRHAAAKIMRGERTGIVGLLLPNIVNEFYARLADRMTQACDERSLHLIIHLTNDAPEKENQAIQRLRELQAMAAFLVPTPGGSSRGRHLDKMKTILLIRKRVVADDSFPAVLIDDRNALREAVQSLVQRGHRRIAYIGADAQLSSGQSRLKAFREGLKKAGLKEACGGIHCVEPDFAEGVRVGSQVLDNPDITSIVCGGVELSNGVLHACMERRALDRSGFAFIGYGDPSFYAWLHQGISTIQLPIDDLADAAIKLLDVDAPGFPDRSEINCPARLCIR